MSSVCLPRFSPGTLVTSFSPKSRMFRSNGDKVSKKKDGWILSRISMSPCILSFSQMLHNLLSSVVTVLKNQLPGTFLESADPSIFW